MESLVAIDKSLLLSLNGLAGQAFIDQVMLFVSARETWLGLAMPVVAWAVFRRDRQMIRLCIVVTLALAVSDLVTYQVLKPAFGRPRPCYELADVVNLVQARCGGDFGFPSNHASNSAATAMVVMLHTRQRWTLALAGAALLVGFSRIYLGVHYPADVLMGFCVGALVGALAFKADRVIRARQSDQK